MFKCISNKPFRVIAVLLLIFALSSCSGGTQNKAAADETSSPAVKQEQPSDGHSSSALRQEQSASEPDKNDDTNANDTKKITDGELKIIAYFPSWKESELDKLSFETITHANYAFAIPAPDGKLRNLLSPILANKLVAKAHEDNAKAMLAVGGWSYNDIPLEETFREATDTPEKIKSLGDDILAMCNEYGFDGVDLDWEYPRLDNGSWKQYEDLVLYLSEKLHSEGKLLTAAVMSGAKPEGGIHYDAEAYSDKALEELDWINVMAYDGGEGELHSSYDFSINSGEYWKSRVKNASRVMLGVPFYARPSWIPYDNILTLDPDANGKDTGLYNGVDVYYNGQPTIAAKTRYAAENLGGVMIWEITQDSQDSSKSLLTAIQETLAEYKG